MAVSGRPFVAAGVALATAGMIAVAPSTPAMLRAATVPAAPVIELTATVDPFAVDPITAWRATFNSTQINWAALVNLWNEAPAPVLQQMLVNWLGYAGELPDVGKIVEQIFANADAAWQALFAYNEDALAEDHQFLFEVLKGEVPADLQPLLDFTTTYSSGIWMGMLGTALSPFMALGDATEDMFGYLTGEDRDLEKALNVLLNIPAIMTDAFFNGYGMIDLTALAADLPLPPGVTIKELGIVLGGLLSPAGALFNALDVEAHVVGIGDLPFPGHKVGPLASWVAQGKVQAEALGWSGTGNPLAPTEDAPAEDAAEDETPVEVTPVEEAPVEEDPAEEDAAEEAPVEEDAAEEGAAEDETPIEEFAQEALAQAASDEEAVIAEAQAEESGAESSSGDAEEASDAGTDTDSGSGVDSGAGGAEAA